MADLDPPQEGAKGNGPSVRRKQTEKPSSVAPKGTEKPKSAQVSLQTTKELCLNRIEVMLKC